MWMIISLFVSAFYIVLLLLMFWHGEPPGVTALTAKKAPVTSSSVVTQAPGVTVAQIPVTSSSRVTALKAKQEPLDIFPKDIRSSQTRSKHVPTLRDIPERKVKVLHPPDVADTMLHPPQIGDTEMEMPDIDDTEPEPWDKNQVEVVMDLPGHEPLLDIPTFDDEKEGYSDVPLRTFALPLPKALIQRSDDRYPVMGLPDDLVPDIGDEIANQPILQNQWQIQKSVTKPQAPQIQNFIMQYGEHAQTIRHLSQLSGYDSLTDAQQTYAFRLVMILSGQGLIKDALPKNVILYLCKHVLETTPNELCLSQFQSELAKYEHSLPALFTWGHTNFASLQTIVNECVKYGFTRTRIPAFSFERIAPDIHVMVNYMMCGYQQPKQTKVKDLFLFNTKPTRDESSVAVSPTPLPKASFLIRSELLSKYPALTSYIDRIYDPEKSMVGQYGIRILLDKGMSVPETSLLIHDALEGVTTPREVYIPYMENKYNAWYKENQKILEGPCTMTMMEKLTKVPDKLKTDKRFVALRKEIKCPRAFKVSNVLKIKKET